MNPSAAAESTERAATKSTTVADRLAEYARKNADQTAVVEPAGQRGGKYQYRSVTYAELDADSNRIANGLIAMGVKPGTRLALLVPPGIKFFSLVFGLLKSGAVAILIDPGMGRRNLIRCLAEADPEGFVAISKAQAIRTVLRNRFPRAKFSVTVGRRWFWGGVSLDELQKLGAPETPRDAISPQDPAAIIFTTGSTGVPKGVLYRHENFDQQVVQIRDHYKIKPGTVDLAGFPLFGLFNSAMGVTTIVPDMDSTRPASVDPEKMLAHIRDWNVTQSFGSPAFWRRVASHCRQQGKQLGTLRRVLSAGAPVPGKVLADLQTCLPDGAEIFTPYGATEALPVASISAKEVLTEAQSQTDEGAGVCVGRRFSGIDWQVIAIDDGPIASIGDVAPVERGEVGELIVRGLVVTREYVTRREVNALAKIADGNAIWHRMGDVGYLDEDDRFWFCGRKAHRVLAADGTMFTIPCEAVFNTHPQVERAALVGVGPAGSQRPVLVVEPLDGVFPMTAKRRDRLTAELREIGKRHDHTRSIRDFLFRRKMPVDIRHNAKIFREKLAVWAARRL